MLFYAVHMDTEQIKKKIVPILESHQVARASVFGSVARGQARPDSDIDLLVKFRKTPSLVEFIRLENELSQALDSEVDVVVEGSEKPFVRQNLERDSISIYGQRWTV